ncbi:Wyosine base formation domain protein [Kribbella flavida DSM 17836]|uniref:Wyosine base formation domain protein n=1 Tax=Kribbella flavida (strain DSM 17836 / JCM 10339 / NBRC 14399) TaxID=479435 RepID=D2PRR6_KRIFD|nr:TIGR03084 family metal-binding protein [Kribbella flavida]ADB29246.1 Wyosine base formation domain protein [Kribbella flavida DSM 17836]
MQLDEVLADLWAESTELDMLVGGLAADGWATPTPAEGWTVAHQIAHLAWTDEAALRAVTDPDAFQAVLDHAAADPAGHVDRGAAEGAALPAEELLPYWRETRAELAEALKQVPAGQKVPWFGPPMSPVSMATARLMETWAHGQDVVDGLGVTRQPSTRLRHVAHLAVRARDFSYLLHDRKPPAAPFHVELTGPDGQIWSYGDESAEQRVTGPALDFCLLATQRRHRDDLAVEAVGADAEEWLGIIQAFAGLPGKGRTAGQFG